MINNEFTPRWVVISLWFRELWERLSIAPNICIRCQRFPYTMQSFRWQNGACYKIQNFNTCLLKDTGEWMLIFCSVKKRSLSWTLKLYQWYSTQIRCVNTASNFVQRHGLGTKKSFSLIIGFCLNFPSLRWKVKTVTKQSQDPQCYKDQIVTITLNVLIRTNPLLSLD